MTDAVPPRLLHAFAPMHKLAFGVAVGGMIALVVLITTVFHAVVRPAAAPNIGLLAQYFYGYTVTVPGAFVGSFWGFVSGFVTGWFVAFTRNLVIATWTFVIRTRAELSATRDFLDHI